MRADVLEWAWLWLRERLRRLLPPKWRSVAPPQVDVRKAWHNEPFYWDVASETHEFTHIVKSGADLTLSAYLAPPPEHWPLS